MAQEKFKLPRSSYEELGKIIQAYSSLQEPAKLAKVTQVSGIGKFTVSANNAFLSAVEIIEGGKTKIATDKGRNLGHALEHNLLEEITKAWRTVVEGSDFLNKMAMAVRIRKGMEISSLEAHIAYSAGEPKTQQVMTGARTVIDILLNSGLVKEEDDRILPEELVPAEEAVRAPEGKPIPSITKVPTLEVSTPSGVSLRIEVRIDAKPSELEGLGEKLKVLIDTLSKGSSEEQKSGGNAKQEG